MSTTNMQADLLTAATSAIMHEEYVPIVDSLVQDRPKVGRDEMFMSQRFEVASTSVDFDSSSLLQDLDMNLDDFVDVVTTYKCKFCNFKCDWKGGLMGHLRGVHRVGGGKAVPATPPEQSEGYPLRTSIGIVKGDVHDTLDDVAKPRIQDKEIFLCGECNQGFLSLDLCKHHMIQQHQPEGVEELHVPTKPRSRVQLKSKPNDVRCRRRRNKQQNPKIECQTVMESLGKRKVRTPKALAEDYYLPAKKRKYRKCPVNEKALKCKVPGCNNSYDTEEAFNFHFRCHVTTTTANATTCEFRCPHCGWMEAAGVWRRMAMHAWRSHDVDTELERCAVCPYRCYDVGRLQEHGLCHREKEVDVATTKTKSRMRCGGSRRHQHKKAAKQQQCPECGRAFADSKCLRKHAQVVHDKLKPYVCQFCSHACARKAMLDLHLRQHTGEKPFACDVCEYRTADHNSLRRHRMRHSGEKPYKCPHCPYACIQTISYKTHLKNKHPGLKGLYCCTVCPYRSVSHENHLNHVKEHQSSPSQAPPQSNESHPAPDVLPGNLTAAQLICTCLNALTQKGDIGEQADSQTITIQIPEGVAAEGRTDPDSSTCIYEVPIYVTIEQQTDVVSSVLDISQTQVNVIERLPVVAVPVA